MARPIALVREGVVIDANAVALALGVRERISEAQARAILHEGTILKYEEEPYREAQRAWLDQCVRYTDTIEPLDPHSAWLDLSLHPQPQEILFELRSLLGVPSRAGVARTKWLARVAADLGDEDQLAFRYPREFLKSLPVRFLEPVAQEHRQRLEFLGYRYAGDVARVPLATLRPQFGDESLVILRAARGEGGEPVRAMYPPDSIHTAFAFDGATDSCETLTHGLKRLARRMAKRLRDADRQSSVLSLKIELEDGHKLQIKRRFTKPIRCERTALAALLLILAEPPPKPVSWIGARLEDLKKTPRSQSDLQGLTPARERDKKVRSALNYVRTVFGDTSLIRGDQVSLPRRVKVLKEWRDATGWR